MFEHMSDAELDTWMQAQMDEGGVQWDALDAEEALSKGDLTHIIIKRDGSVSVNRGSSWADERLGVQVDTVAEAVHKASRCRSGRKAGVEIRQLAEKDALPPVCDDHRPYRWQM